jgi:hypothetical protein
MRIIFSYILILFLWACQESRVPASKEIETHNDLLIGEYKLKNHQRLVLIGVNSDLSGYEFNAHQIGFSSPHGHDLTRVDPKFLMSFNQKGLQRVYSFEYGNSLKRRIIPSPEHDGQFYLKFKTRDHEPKLPQMLVDLTDTKLAKRPLAWLQVVSHILSFTYLAPVSVVVDQLVDITEAKKEYQAGYLERWIQMALDGQLPEFKQIVSEEELLKLGGSLRIRFRGEDPAFDTTFINNKNKVQHYKKYLDFHKEVRSSNMSKLIERANEEGLLAIPLAEDLIFLYYDLNYKINPSQYKKLITGKIDFNQIHSKYGSIFGPNESLVPIGIFSLNHPEIPLSAVDFRSPDQNIKQEDWARFLRFAVELGMSFVSNSKISTSLSLTKGAATLLVRKSGKTIFHSRLYSQAQLTALIESGALDLYTPGLLKQALLDQLSEIGLEEDQVEHYRNKVQSIQSDEGLQVVLRELILLFEDSQKEKRKWAKIHGGYVTSNKYISWMKLSAFMRSKSELKKFSQWLDKREKNQWPFNRYPSAEYPLDSIDKQTPNDIRPLILFYIAGISPTTLDYMLKNYPLPNIKHFFFDQGLGLDVFTTQSLTNPSMATLLTGHEVDRHTVRSESEIRRGDGNVARNYTDSRHETYLPIYGNNSRSFIKIEKVGLDWFYSNFEKEIRTNYLPVHKSGKSPKLDYVTTAAKMIPDFLSGVFSHDIAYSSAVGLQTAKSIKNNPGKYRLISNWYDCSDYLLRYNNQAVFYCLVEIDKRIGEILNIAKQDNLLKNAQVFLLSDKSYADGVIEFDGKQQLLDNTGFHLTKFFTGDYAQLGKYDLTVSTFSSPEPDYDVKFWQEYLIQPTRVVYRGKSNDRPKDVSVMIDPIGDNQAKLFFKHPRYAWRSALNFCDLTQYPASNGVDKFDIPSDLLNFKLRNISITNNKLRNLILKESDGGSPVQFLSKAIQDGPSLDKIRKDFMLEFDQYPSLLWNNHGAVLVVQKWYQKRRYIKYFPLDAPLCNGKELVLKQNKEKDILKVTSIITPDTWYIESDILNLLKLHDYPVVFTHLMTVFNLHPDLNQKQIEKGDLEQEIPDFVLYSHRGFNFNSGKKSQADSGHFHRRNSKILARYTELNKPLFYSSQDGLSGRALFMKDIAPTVIYNSIHSLDHPAWLKSWDDLLPYLK